MRRFCFLAVVLVSVSLATPDLLTAESLREAREAMAKGETDKAIRVLLALSEDQSSSLEWQILMGLAFLAKGEPQRAVELLEKRPDHQDHARVLGLLGNAYLAMGADREAELRLRLGLELAPDHEPIRYFLILSLANQRRFEEASRLGRESLSVAGPSARLSLLTGMTVYLSGQPEAADHHFEEAKRLSGYQPATLDRLIDFLRLVQDQRRLKTLLTETLELYPDQPEYLAAYASTLNELGQLGEAAEFVDRATRRLEERFPESGSDPQALLSLGVLYFLRGELEPAEKMFLEALEHSPSSRSYRHLASFYLQSGRLEEASKITAEALSSLSEPDPELMLIRGRSLIQEGRYEDALSIFRRVLSGSPNQGEALLGAARASFRLQQWESSAEYLEHYLVYRPSDSAAHLLMARTMRSLQREDEARHYLQRARELDEASRTQP